MEAKKLKDIDGCRVKTLVIDENGEHITIHAGENEEAIISHEYYGDHAQNWIVVYENGTERFRVNTKYIVSFILE